MSEGKNSNPESMPSRTALQDSQSESISSNSGQIAKADAKIEDRTGLYLAVIAVILSALSLGMTIVNPKISDAKVENLQDRVQTAERESRVMQERWNDLKVELAKRGIPVSDH